MSYGVAILEFDDDVNHRLVVAWVTLRKWEERRLGDVDNLDDLKSNALIRRMNLQDARSSGKDPREERLRPFRPAGITYVNGSDKRLTDRIEKDSLDGPVAFRLNPDSRCCPGSRPWLAVNRQR